MVAPATDGPKTPAKYRRFVRGNAVDDPCRIAMTQRVQEKRKARIKKANMFLADPGPEFVCTNLASACMNIVPGRYPNRFFLFIVTLCTFENLFQIGKIVLQVSSPGGIVGNHCRMVHGNDAESISLE